jgi:hypothetical protein
MMNKNIILLITLCVSLNVNIFAQIFLPIQITSPDIKLDWPLFDLPYQIDAMNTVGHGFFSGYANPSMTQSLALSKNIVTSFNFGMKYFYDHVTMNEWLKKYIYFSGVSLGVLLFFYMPGAEGWMHEEYHRAVLTRFGANSFNGMNLFPIGADVVYVSAVDDNDMSRIKKKSPPDLVRLFEAGIEGEYVQISRLQRDNFFYDQQLLHEIGYWFTTLNSHMYVLISASPDLDLPEDEADIASRDFAGYDLTTWVYDLFRPHEPYEDRGSHPTGEGVSRYISVNDLTNDELRYLRLQGGLQYLNYLSPMMFGIRTLPLGENGDEINFAMRHYLTSFGADIAAQVFLKIRPFNMAFTLHNYMNYQNYFPAVEAELVDFPLTIGKLDFFLSPRVLIGMQPQGQTFKTANPEFLGLFGLRVDFIAHRNIFPYIDFTAKTNGWVAGNEYLEANASVRMGVSLRF